jgi:hypothetical protein
MAPAAPVLSAFGVYFIDEEGSRISSQVFSIPIILAAQHFLSYSDSLIECLIQFGAYISTTGDDRISAQPA